MPSEGHSAHHSPSLVSPRRHLPSDVTTSTVSAVQLHTNRDHHHLTSVTLSCYTCSILLLVVVNLLLCLICKLNSIRHMYIQGKTQYLQGPALCEVFSVPRGAAVKRPARWAELAACCFPSSDRDVSSGKIPRYFAFH